MPRLPLPSAGMNESRRPHLLGLHQILGVCAALLCLYSMGAHATEVITIPISISAESLRVASDGDWDVISYPSSRPDMRRDHIGTPQLPVISRLVLLPPGMRVDDVLVTTHYSLPLPGRYLPRPVPDVSDTVDVPPEDPEYPDQEFPSSRALLVNAGDMRGYQLATVAVWPVSYEAGSRRLSVATEMRLSITLRPINRREMDDMVPVGRPDLIDGPFGVVRKWIRQKAANPEGLTTWYPRRLEEEEQTPSEKSVIHGGTFFSYWPSDDGQGVPQIIVTNNHDEAGNYLGEMVEEFEFYASYYSPVGQPTIVRTVDEIVQQYDGHDAPSRSAPSSPTPSVIGELMPSFLAETSQSFQRDTWGVPRDTGTVQTNRRTTGILAYPAVGKSCGTKTAMSGLARTATTLTPPPSGFMDSAPYPLPGFLREMQPRPTSCFRSS